MPLKWFIINYGIRFLWNTLLYWLRLPKTVCLKYRALFLCLYTGRNSAWQNLVEGIQSSSGMWIGNRKKFEYHCVPSNPASPWVPAPLFHCVSALNPLMFNCSVIMEVGFVNIFSLPNWHNVNPCLQRVLERCWRKKVFPFQFWCPSLSSLLQSICICL